MSYNTKYPLMLSKFRPSDVDPNIPVYERPNKFILPDNQEKQDVLRKISRKVCKEQPPSKAQKNFMPKATSVQTALMLLGIDMRVVYETHGRSFGNSGSFWKRPTEYHWRMLELAKRRYELEIIHCHPDKQGVHPLRASQVNAAWRLVKGAFLRRGFSLEN